MASGYYSTDSGADESFKAGWFYPGDLGWLRDDGGLVLRGRTADLLNIGGLKLNPNVIDRYLVSIDGVRDALSFEYEDAMGATRIGAAVVVEGSFDARLLPNLIAHDLDADYRPTQVVVVDRLARNQAGKALRTETRILALGR
jgi:acyl-coenzyme A synthetase/AMP-(fatty) acid ligase